MKMCGGFILEIILKSHKINCFNLLSCSNEKYFSNLPAEVFMKYGNFQHLLSLDATSTSWNVCHDNKISVSLPINDLI